MQAKGVDANQNFTAQAEGEGDAVQSPEGLVVDDSEILDRALQWQGKESSLSEAALVQRYRLRWQTSVTQELDLWWDCIQKHLHHHDQPEGFVDEAVYALVFRKIFKAMTNGYSESECISAIHRDWCEDSKNEPAMPAQKVALPQA